MKPDRIKTILIDASGSYGKLQVLADTVFHGMLHVESSFQFGSPLDKLRLISRLNRCIAAPYDNLSYVRDWRAALCKSPRLDLSICNINNLLEYRRFKNTIKEAPLVIVMHSAAGDNLTMLRATSDWFTERRGKLVVFLGNEYDILDEKISFIQNSGAEYVCSQLPIESARWLYQECSGCTVLPMPHALNPEVYFPDNSAERTIDVGFRGSFYDNWIGDQDRNSLIRAVNDNASRRGLRCDIGAGRMPRHDWATYLNSCLATVGAEAGTYFLDKRGLMLKKAKEWCMANPDAGVSDIQRRFFQSPDVKYVSGKCVSSRHFEPTGTKTCQILLDGNYNGILKADHHYISVGGDHSNLSSALEKLRDQEYIRRMCNTTFDYIMAYHTYDARVQKLLDYVSQTRISQC